MVAIGEGVDADSADLMGYANLRAHPTAFGTLFARVSFATTVPFALTTMLVELGIALLELAGILQPLPTLTWLSGDGLWFATIYQMGGIIWLIGLLIIATKVSLPVRWWLGIVLGVALSAVYATPIALFIR